MHNAVNIHNKRTDEHRYEKTIYVNKKGADQPEQYDQHICCSLSNLYSISLFGNLGNRLSQNKRISWVFGLIILLITSFKKSNSIFGLFMES